MDGSSGVFPIRHDLRGKPRDFTSPRILVDAAFARCYTPAQSNILGLKLGRPHNLVGLEVWVDCVVTAR
jgi:hypothetical protein